MASQFLVLVVIFVILASIDAQSTFKCPPKDGQYEDPEQCDKFYECKEGRATVKLCPDGLVFDPLNRKINKCDQPFNVECGNRLELQQPISNYLCPRKNGFFAHPEENVCNIFYNCIDGDATETICPTGLYFNEYKGTCTWPEASERVGCAVEEKPTLKDGFSCPKEGKSSASGQAVAHPVYAHPDDCQKFYVCLNGLTPREQGCQPGEAFNDVSQKCDAAENVPGCEDYYEAAPGKPGQKKTRRRRNVTKTTN